MCFVSAFLKASGTYAVMLTLHKASSQCQAMAVLGEQVPACYYFPLDCSFIEYCNFIGQKCGF